jgi:Mrp family chromosome partitioning ATPase
MLQIDSTMLLKKSAQLYHVPANEPIGVLMIILVGGEKGGSGKSCLAQNLGVHLVTEQKASLLLVDCDP